MTNPCSEKETLVLLKDGAARREEKLDKIIDILEGNGKPGLKTQVAIHRTYFKLIAAIGGPVLIFLTARTVWSWIGS